MNLALWRADIEQVRNELPRLHPNFFAMGNQEAFYTKIDLLLRRLDKLEPGEIVMELARIVATAKDAHTALALPQRYRLPFDCYPFAEGLYITDTDDRHSDLLYTKIVAIDGNNIVDICGAIAEIIPHENDQFVLSQLPKHIPCADTLFSSKIIDDIDNIALTLENGAGKSAQHTVRAVERTEYQARQLDIPNLPLYRQRAGQFYWSHWQHGIFYVNYNKCRNMEPPAASVDDFCQNLISTLENNHTADKLVIDLRQNSGGNSALFKPFLKWLSNNKTFNRQGKLFVIVGRDTFSSATLNLHFLKQHTTAIIVGERTGGKPNHFGEIKYLELVHSGLYIRYSTKFYPLIDDDELMSFVPDIECEVRAVDYMTLTDPCINAIIAFQ